MPYRGPGLPIETPQDELGNPNLLAVAAFVDSVRTGTRPLADERVGWASAVAVARGNEAIRGKRYVEFANLDEREE
jgi:hypothetical protein